MSWLEAESKPGEAVRVMDQFQYAMFCLLVLMCFRDKLEEKKIQEIETVQRRWMLSLPRFNILNLWPRVGKVLFRRCWEECYGNLKNHEDIMLPYIRARQQLKQEEIENKQYQDYELLFVDTLLDLQLP